MGYINELQLIVDKVNSFRGEITMPQVAMNLQ